MRRATTALAHPRASRSRLAEAVELALKTSGGQVIVAEEEPDTKRGHSAFSKRPAKASG